MALSADGHTLAGADAPAFAEDTTGRVHLWDLRTAAGARLLPRRPGAPGSVAFAGRALLTIRDDGTIRRWDPGARSDLAKSTRLRGLSSVVGPHAMARISPGSGTMVCASSASG